MFSKLPSEIFGVIDGMGIPIYSAVSRDDFSIPMKAFRPTLS
jgi:hypothetical protein